MVAKSKTVGVLALQGDVREHARMLSDCSVEVRLVKNSEDLTDLAGLVIPGGESTTISMLINRANLMQSLRDFIKSGKAVYGSCAGMILLADRILDGRSDQETIGGLDITVRRNAFGRQVDSFEKTIDLKEINILDFNAVFIRAPWVEKVGSGVEVLASLDYQEQEPRIVMVKQGNLLATSFHPELTGDNRVHQYFVSLL
ncbi:MAG: pyridoxal 5'-phosphate synthase glutaminase subunit PdxT [Candidatus Nanopelagicales bacterium]